MPAGVDVGLSRDGLERFGAVAASHVGDGKVPGLVALVAQGEEVYVEAFGTLAIGGKPVEGAVTVRGLLTFTFGFGMALEMFTAAEPWPVVTAAMRAGLATIGPPQPDAFVDPDTWIARFGELPLLAQPGQRWLYNTGAHVLSVLCARAA